MRFMERNLKRNNLENKFLGKIIFEKKTPERTANMQISQDKQVNQEEKASGGIFR